MSVRIVGVRHHSPACARAVAHVLERVKPRWILIEGPSDMNGRMHELVGLAHRLPVALFHFLSGDDVHLGSFTPFCETSPEWVALEWGRANGAELRFCDLPSSHKAFHTSENRTADRVDRYDAIAARLCERLGIDGSDAVWDHLFEQPDSPDVLLERLDRYFDELRPDDRDAPERDLVREAFMAQAIAWAARQGGPVVVVCGGFHKPALERAWPTARADWPELPPHPAEHRTGTFVVPWSDRRLDSFSGYAAGMPSPGWYTEIARHGPVEGARRMLDRAVERLRAVKHPVSAADRVAVEVLLAGLVSLRNHRAPTRTDVLDALCSGLVKEALDVPPPWTERSGIGRGTDARLIAILDAFQGSAVGSVHPSTPRPPLVSDALARLAGLGLALAEPPGTRVELDLFDPGDLERSRVLHQLRILEIPRLLRDRGPADPGAADRREQWTLIQLPGTLTALLEASIWGGTLGDAARAKLLSRMSETAGLQELIEVLVDLLFAGFGDRATEVLAAVRGAVQQERSLGALGAALKLLVDLWRHETVFVGTHSALIGGLIHAVFRRAVWVFEESGGGAGDPARLQGAIGLREALRHGELEPSDRAAAAAMLARRAADPEAPADLRGAAVGLRSGLGEAVGDEALRAVRGIGPDALGDWLSGLFAVTRETLHEQTELLTALHARLEGMDPADFLVALPALRLAFAWFPPRERETLGEAVLRLLNRSPGEARELVRSGIAPSVLLDGLELEGRVEAVLLRYHLLEVP